jgi:hypothetical protein
LRRRVAAGVIATTAWRYWDQFDFIVSGAC